MFRHSERQSSQYHFGAVQDQQKWPLTRAPAVPSVHAGADGVGGTQQCTCYSLQFHNTSNELRKHSSLKYYSDHHRNA